MAEAERILDLCEHFHVLPKQLMEESASLLRMLALRRAGQITPAFTQESGDD